MCAENHKKGISQMKTKVAFKIERNPHTKQFDVFAFFPNAEDEHGKEMFTSYSHVGQHGICAKSYFNSRRWATYSEYIDLYHELLNIGYKNLEVLNPDWKDYDEDGFYIGDTFGMNVNSVEAKVS